MNDFGFTQFASIGVFVLFALAFFVLMAVDKVRSRGREDPPLITAVRNHDVRRVRALLESGASPHEESRRGMTPLMELVRSTESRTDGEVVTHYEQTSAIEIATLLLDHGAKVNAKDVVGLTPLDVAITSDLDYVAPFLRSRGGVQGDMKLDEAKMKALLARTPPHTSEPPGWLKRWHAFVGRKFDEWLDSDRSPTTIIAGIFAFLLAVVLIPLALACATAVGLLWLVWHYALGRS